MKNAKILFAVLIALLTAPYSDAQVSLKIKLSSPEHSDTVLIYDIPDSNLYTVNDVSFRMKSVAGGIFTMGCGCYMDELPSHNVTLSSYYMGETEVTQALWKAVMGVNPSRFQSSTNSDTGSDNYPVERVSWEDIVGTDASAIGYILNGITYYQNGFCYKLSQLAGGGKQFRLPTESEWEYAARGGSKAECRTQYSGSDNIDDVAWYNGNSSSTTHEVKTKQANALGLYDMSGNVYEWCGDWYREYSSESQTNPTGTDGDEWSSGRVFRGGSWDNDAGFCRVSRRPSGYYPNGQNSIVGFRLAL